jgi:ATP-binding cassette subfamily F protein 3
MDEPTNHLISNPKCLESSLQKYEGTLFGISRQDFLQGMSNLVYEFREKDKRYLGDVNYFLEQRNLENMRSRRRCAQGGSLKDNKSPMKNKKREKHCRIV